MNIAVYLGSTSGNKDEFTFAARSFGRWIEEIARFLAHDVLRRVNQ